MYRISNKKRLEFFGMFAAERLRPTIHCAPIINRIAFKPDTTDYWIHKISKFNGKIIFLKNNNGHKISGCLLLGKSSKHVILSSRGQGGSFSDKISGLACLRDLGYHVFTIDYQDLNMFADALMEDFKPDIIFLYWKFL